VLQLRKGIVGAHYLWHVLSDGEENKINKESRELGPVWPYHRRDFCVVMCSMDFSYAIKPWRICSIDMFKEIDIDVELVGVGAFLLSSKTLDRCDK
jgi:hypothetical protein